MTQYEVDIQCPHCKDDRQVELLYESDITIYYRCDTCSRSFFVEKPVLESTQGKANAKS